MLCLGTHGRLCAWGRTGLLWLETVPVLYSTENTGSTGFLLVQQREIESSVFRPLEVEFRAPGSSSGFNFFSHLLSLSREITTDSKPQISLG